MVGGMLFLTIIPNDELPPSEPYTLLVRIVARESSLLDPQLEQRLERLADRMTTQFRKCTGVTLVGECAVVSNEEFTFADMSRGVEWDVYDDLSYRAEADARTATDRLLGTDPLSVA